MQSTIHFLGHNATFRILTQNIFARNEVSCVTLFIPFRIEFPSFHGYSKRNVIKADINFIKGELRTENGIKCSDNILLDIHSVDINQLSLESQFSFSIPHHTLSIIEKRRTGDMHLSIAVASQAAIYESIRLSNGEDRSFISDLSRGSGHVNVTIPQSQWINSLLPNMGYESLRLIEIPAMSQVIPSEYSTSLRELEEARRFYTNGEYDKAVGHCRSALDPFKAKKDEIKTFVKSRSELAWVNDVLEATDAWLVKLVKATSHFTSKAHHIPSVGHFGRVEAEIIIMVTVALISYIGKLETTK